MCECVSVGMEVCLCECVVYCGVCLCEYCEEMLVCGEGDQSRGVQVCVYVCVFVWYALRIHVDMLVRSGFGDGESGTCFLSDKI